MRYMGNKNRYAKDLLSIILKDRRCDQWYVEPFVGSFSVIDKVSGNRIANDINYYLIELFKAIQDGWIPPETVSEAEYKEIRINKDKYPACLVGFVGFGCSYAGKWFGGYARGAANNGKSRNYCNENKRSILKQVAKIKGIIIPNKNYQELQIPPNSIIYCDIPYKNTTKYKDDFDHIKFWNWARNMINIGHDVFVSEYFAPNDFVSVWSKAVNNFLTKETSSKHCIEKLFKHKSKF